MNNTKIASVLKSLTRITMPLLITLVGLFNGPNVQAQIRKNIVIYGKLSTALVKELKNTLDFEVYTEMYGAGDINLFQTYTAHVTGNTFKVVIKPKADFTYFTCDSLPALGFHYLIMAQPGDSLYFDVKSRDDFSFRSNRHDYYQCQLELNKATEDITGRNPIPQGKAYFEFYESRRDTILNIIDSTLNSFQNTIDPTSLTLLRVNYMSNLNLNYQSMLGAKILYEGNYTELEKKTAIAYVKDLYAKEEILNDPLIIRNSIWYGIYIYDLERLYNGMENSTENFNQERFEKTFNRINTKYSGLLREKLLTIFFIRSSIESNQSAAYLEKSFLTIQDPLYKKILLELERSKMPGNDAYPFSLESENGKVYSLSDFKGKVLVCDFWYNGCGGCAGLATAMLPLKEKYKNDPNVVFLSINTDGKKERWKNGIARGIYTSSHDLNLYTNGLGFHHPMIAFYKYSAYPQLLLIDKEGKIINSSPQKPSDKESLEQLDRLIQGYLK